MKTCCEVGIYIAPSFLTSALNGGKGSASRPVHFILGETAGLDAVEMRKISQLIVFFNFRKFSVGLRTENVIASTKFLRRRTCMFRGFGVKKSVLFSCKQNNLNRI
jgi:hypothetical protein